jgi:hypothetical protein
MPWLPCNNGTLMLKRDNIAFGALIGLVLPGLFYGLLRLLSLLVETGSVWARPFEPDKMMMLALVINLIPIRVYFVTYKFDKTGRGVLLMTFLLMAAYFLYKKYS